MALTDQLVSHWKFDEASGNAADAHGSNTLVNNGSAAYAAAKINNGVDLEASSAQFMKAADSASLDITGDITLAYWLKVESAPATDTAYVVASKWDDGTAADRAYNLQYGDSGGTNYLYFEYRDGIGGGATDATRSSFNTTLTPGTLYYVVITVAAATGVVKFYIDAVSNTGTNSATNASAIQSGAAGYRVGALGLTSGSETAYFDGIVDEHGMWSRALSSTEVTELYNGGAGLAYPFTVAAATSQTLTMMGVGS